MEKVDPNWAKARSVLKEEDMEVEALDGEWDGYKEPLPQETPSYMDAPLLTIRQLMPGSTGEDEDDRELDQSFRADKIEFMVVQRKLSAAEKEADTLTGPSRNRMSTRTSWGPRYTSIQMNDLSSFMR